MYKHACKTRLEGIICKVRHSRYTWVALTIGRDAAQRGFALHGKKFNGIYLGRHKGGGCYTPGRLIHRFYTASATDLQARPKPLIPKRRA